MRKLSISGRASAWRAGGTRFRARWTAISGIGSPSTMAATAPAAATEPRPSGSGVPAAAGGAVWPRKKAADRRLMIAAASHGFRTLRMELLLVPEKWVIGGIRGGRRRGERTLGRPASVPQERPADCNEVASPRREEVAARAILSSSGYIDIK